jgi:phytoene dehydrogenase-like protein
MQKTDVVIVGAGLAGLTCALRLQQAGRSCLVFEASDAVGGRVRTDRVDGFQLDRGFQVLLTAYPECRRMLDYDALQLRNFLPGAIIRQEGKFHRLADPWRQPSRALESLMSPGATLADKIRVAILRFSLRSKEVDDLFAGEEKTTLEKLRESGFSERIIASFFRPFLGGVFLDPQLETSSRMFEFVFKMFSEGDVAVPERGMQAIPESMAAALDADAVRLNTRVERVAKGGCHLTTGEEIRANAVVVATDGTDGAQWLRGLPELRWRSTACFYFDAAEPPFEDPILMLDGDGRGPANSVTVMSQVAPSYAPLGRSLVSVSVIDANDADMDDLERGVRDQLKDWFGAVVDDWRAVRHYKIPRSLPVAGPVKDAPATIIDGVFACGDHLESASIQGAMVSGRKAAEAVIRRGGD